MEDTSGGFLADEGPGGTTWDDLDAVGANLKAVIGDMSGDLDHSGLSEFSPKPTRTTNTPEAPPPQAEPAPPPHPPPQRPEEKSSDSLDELEQLAKQALGDADMSFSMCAQTSLAHTPLLASFPWLYPPQPALHS